MSSIHFGKITEKTQDNPYGFKEVDDIPLNEPCIVVLGGDGVVTNKDGKGEAKSLYYMLQSEVEGVSVYVGIYDFTDNKKEQSRRLNHVKNLRDTLSVKVPALNDVSNNETLNPQYIEEAFNKLLLPRISILNGKKRISLNEACRRIRMINFDVRCHGGYVAFKLEEKMQKEMVKLGYNKDEMKKIQSQLLFVAKDSAAPTDHLKSAWVCFNSVRDTVYPNSPDGRLSNNLFNNYLYNKIKEDKQHFQAIIDGNEKRAADLKEFNLRPCLVENQGNMFLIKQRYPYPKNDVFQVDENNIEHNFNGFYDSSQTPQGQMMCHIRKTVIVNGVKNSILQQNKHEPLPNLRNLVLSDNPKEQKQKEFVEQNFDKMIENGQNLRQQIYQDTLIKRQNDLGFGFTCL